jgi:hypothetical protein
MTGIEFCYEALLNNDLRVAFEAAKVAKNIFERMCLMVT